MIDIVFPDGNEQEFLSMADRLGIQGLCFVYDRPHAYPGAFSASLVKGREKRNADLTLMVNPMDVRKSFEHIRPDIVFGLELVQKADFIHQRNSGLNHITCLMARDNQVAVGLSFASTQGRYGARSMGRMSANIRLCRKYKVPMIIATLAESPYLMRGPAELKSLFVTLGMHPAEASKALEAAGGIISRTSARREGRIIADGAEIV
jgi:RNase P/RNase MRP subunit p30